jgi:hypothetical protein
MGFGEEGFDRKLLGLEREFKNVPVKKCNTNVIICCLH